MKHESIGAATLQRNKDRAEGVKHTPLHTLPECCEEAGVTMQWFGRMKAAHPGAPQPVLISSNSIHRARGYARHYRKHEVLAWIKQIQEKLATQEKGTVIMPDIKTALQTALEKAAQTQVAQPAQTAQPAQDIPADWDDEGGAKQITEKFTTNHKEHTVTNATTNLTAQQAQHLFKPTNNVTRETFEYVRVNAGCTRRVAVHSLVAKGFKESSVTSIITQMLRQGMIRLDAVGRLFTTTNEYAPIKSWASKGRVVKTQEKAPMPPILEIVKQRKKPGPKPGFRKAKAAAQQAVQTPAQVLEEKKAVLMQPAKEWSAQRALEGLSVLQAKALYDELKKLFG